MMPTGVSETYQGEKQILIGSQDNCNVLLAHLLLVYV